MRRSLKPRPVKEPVVKEPAGDPYASCAKTGEEGLEGRALCCHGDEDFR